MYGYAGMPWWNSFSDASSTCVSPTSEATIGFSMPRCPCLVDGVDHQIREHHAAG